MSKKIKKQSIIQHQTAIWRTELFDSLRLAMGLLILVLLVGAFGYLLIEGWSFQESIYMSVTTLATVGLAKFIP